MKALITTAGMGRRMQSKEGSNKCLLEIGGKSILEHSVDSLMDEGVKDICIVTGYQSQDVEDVIKDRAVYVNNSEYEKKGLIYSLSKAREECCGQEILLIMGDLFYHRDMISTTIMEEGDIVVTYERKDEYVPEDSKAVVSNGFVQYMGKDISPDETSGEFGHMIKLSKKGSQILFDEIDNFIKQDDVNAYLMDVINQIISKGIKVNALDITGIPRIEIDFAEDLEEAKTIILPKIARGV